MNQLQRLFVWLSRIHHCRGFGIQSPTDYWMVRYVINEHWPYYKYREIEQDDRWLRRKLGRLFFRIANWRQPQVILCRDYHAYWQAGCCRASVNPEGWNGAIELMHIDIDEAKGLPDRIEKRVDNRSVLVVEGLWRNWEAWRQLVADSRCQVTFDLYYCGIVLFDSKRVKQNYIINF